MGGPADTTEARRVRGHRSDALARPARSSGAHCLRELAGRCIVTRYLINGRQQPPRDVETAYWSDYDVSYRPSEAELCDERIRHDHTARWHSVSGWLLVLTMTSAKASVAICKLAKQTAVRYPEKNGFQKFILRTIMDDVYDICNSKRVQFTRLKR